ncbi:MAG TPA: cation:proton antiporter [Bryobacteraceae bacterium]|nr:cation:proton antiporter [Bryobacteraceae bacterium]
MQTVPHDFSRVFIELGAAIGGLGILARLASRWGFSSVPLYLLGGLAFGNGGLLPLNLSGNFIRIGAEIGVLLLLFMLGLEYTGNELREHLRGGLPAGGLDFLLNFLPGVIAGRMFGWSWLAACVLGGVTWVSSSGVIAKVLGELKRLGNPETPAVLSVLVLEDLAMAVYLPLITVWLSGGSAVQMAVSVSVALVAVAAALVVAFVYGPKISGWVAHESDEVVLLTTLAIVLLLAGFAQHVQVSAAVAAFLAGVALSGPIAEKSRKILAPLRDLFAAIFFFFFGLEIAPASLPPVAMQAVGLGVATALTKIGTGYFAAQRAGIHGQGCWRAGVSLIARGEFSIIIAGFGAIAEPQLGPLSAAYVLLLAITGPILARLV